MGEVAARRPRPPGLHPERLEQDPRRPLLGQTRSRRLTLSGKQLEAVRKFSDGLNIPGVEAVLGEAADYTELAFTHLDKTGKRLFGSDYGFNYTRTQTRVEGLVASVGDLYADNGLDVDNWNPTNRNDNLFAAPLILSSKKVKWYFAWLILSIRQAFSLFRKVLFVNQDNSFRLLTGCLLQGAGGFLKDQV